MIFFIDEAWRRSSCGDGSCQFQEIFQFEFCEKSLGITDGGKIVLAGTCAATKLKPHCTNRSKFSQ